MDKLIKKKSIKPLLTILVIILGLGLSLGAVYFMYYRKDDRLNQLSSALVSIDLEDSGAVTLNSSLPVIDEVGLESTPHNFTITNTSSVSIDVNIKLNIKNTTTFTTSEYSAVRYGLYINDELVKKDYVHSDNLNLYTYESLAVGESISCKLYMWIDYYFDTQGKIFEANIKAEAQSRDLIPTTLTLNLNGGTGIPTSISIDKGATTYGKLPTPTQEGYNFAGWFTSAEGGTEVTSSTSFTYGTSPTTLYAHWESDTYTIACPGEGCYYTRGSGTWHGAGLSTDTIDPNNLPSGVSTNYSDVVEYNTFIALKLNNSNQVEHAYACGIEGSTPFCIEGTYDSNPDKAKIQEANLAILTPIFNSCSGTVGSYISCSGSLTLSNDSNGSAAVSYDDGRYYYSCRVGHDGHYESFVA